MFLSTVAKKVRETPDFRSRFHVAFLVPPHYLVETLEIVFYFLNTLSSFELYGSFVSVFTFTNNMYI